MRKYDYSITFFKDEPYTSIYFNTPQNNYKLMKYGEDTNIILNSETTSRFFIPKGYVQTSEITVFEGRKLWKDLIKKGWVRS